MMKIAWTIRAQKRVIEILEYSQQEFGNKAADRLARTIEQKTLQLINNPFRGPVELILAKEKQISCRYLLVNPYILCRRKGRNHIHRNFVSYTPTSF